MRTHPPHRAAAPADRPPRPTVVDDPRAHCRDVDNPDDLFPSGKAQKVTTQVCAGCLLRVQCLTEAMEREIDHGVWGGLTVRERRALRKVFGAEWDLAITTAPAWTPRRKPRRTPARSEASGASSTGARPAPEKKPRDETP